MAGLPTSIVQRANEVLSDLEGNNRQDTQQRIVTQTNKPTIGTGKATIAAPEGMQLSIFQLDDPVLEQIRDEVKSIDINNLTPLEALNKLNEIKKLVGNKG